MKVKIKHAVDEKIWGRQETGEPHIAVYRYITARCPHCGYLCELTEGKGPEVVDACKHFGEVKGEYAFFLKRGMQY
jgi:hypothetical protein